MIKMVRNAEAAPAARDVFDTQIRNLAEAVLMNGGRPALDLVVSEIAARSEYAPYVERLLGDLD
jgi:hypothetical protein